MQGKSHCTEAQNLQSCTAELVLLIMHWCLTQIHIYSSKLNRELDLKDCRIIPPSPLAFSAHHSLISCLLSSPHRIS